MKLGFEPLISGSFTAVDVETTGLYPEQGARMIEVAAVRVRGFEIVDSYSTLLNPGVPISSKIKKLNGISNEMLISAPDFGNVLGSLIAFIGNDYLVAHNASFDKKFLQAECRCLDKAIKNKFLCTLFLSKQAKVDVENYKLITLLNYFEIFLEDALHRALSDATAVALLCTKLIKLKDSREFLKKSLV